MNSKLLASYLNKYAFHHKKALEEAEIAGEQLETLIVSLMAEKKHSG